MTSVIRFDEAPGFTRAALYNAQSSPTLLIKDSLHAFPNRLPATARLARRLAADADITGL
jgi:hypothetical protein